MNEKLLHTPEGVRDIYDAECKKNKKVNSQIHHKLEKGYADIEKGNVEDAASAFVAFRERHKLSNIIEMLKKYLQ